MSGNSIKTPLSYTSFTLPHPVKHYLAPSSDLLIISDAINSSLINIIPQNQTQVDMITVKGNFADSDFTIVSEVVNINFVSNLF